MASTYINICIVPGLSSDPPRNKEYGGLGRWGGMESRGKIRQTKTRENSPFIDVEPLNVHQSTQTYILLAALIFPERSRG
jgi:hypothetical protein